MELTKREIGAFLLGTVVGACAIGLTLLLVGLSLTL